MNRGRVVGGPLGWHDNRRLTRPESRNSDDESVHVDLLRSIWIIGAFSHVDCPTASPAPALVSGPSSFDRLIRPPLWWLPTIQPDSCLDKRRLVGSQVSAGCLNRPVPKSPDYHVGVASEWWER